MTYTLLLESANGKSILFSLAGGFVISSITDLTSQNVTFKTSTGVGNVGTKLEAQVVEPKRLSISGHLVGDVEEKRKRMMQTIVPLVKTTITFDGKYKLECWPQKTPDIERYPNHPQFNFILYAPNPYWQSADGKSVDLLGLTKKWRFPWNISSPNPFRFSEYTTVYYTNVYNGGNVPSKWRAEFYARAPLSSPVVTNMITGQFVRVKMPLETGELLIVDTTGQELSVTHYAADGTPTDAFEHLDIESYPFLLQVGDNLIKTDAAENREGLSVRMIYADNVSGVWA